MKLPSLSNLRIRPVRPSGGSGLCPLCPSDTKMSPFGAVITSHGSLSCPGPVPRLTSLPKGEEHLAFRTDLDHLVPLGPSLVAL